MIFRSLKVVACAIVMTLGTNAFAVQDCGSVAQSANYGDEVSADATCGRGTSYAHAASLWAGYCTDDCSYNGCSGSCSLFKNRKQLGHFGRCGRRASSCDQCTECDDACGTCGRGGGCKLRGMFSRNRGCGCDSGNFGWPDSCGCESDPCGGGGLFAHHRSRDGVVRGRIRQNSNCTCGTTDGYFNQFVGADYGKGEFQSCVKGCLSPYCGANTQQSTFVPANVKDASKATQGVSFSMPQSD